jgi:hypothetical protein
VTAVNARIKARIEKRKREMTEIRQGSPVVPPTPIIEEPQAVKKPPTSLDDIMTDEQVQSWLQVNEQWLADHRTRVEPKIPFFKVGNLIRYSRSELEQWLWSQRQAC